MLISILEKINNFNEWIFEPIDKLLLQIPVNEAVLDAIIDSIHLLPFLFFIFVAVEILEYYFSDKLDNIITKSKTGSVIVGSLASIFPQCGFSVIASGLYIRKIITRGCLIATYIGTSDEMIPILLAHPTKAHLIVPIVGIKLFIAIFAGFLVDLIFPNRDKEISETVIDEKEGNENCGCCHHDVKTTDKFDVLIHPIKHTLNIFAFILIITILLNFVIELTSLSDMLTSSSSKVIQTICVSVFGLIPNCAISIAVTMMLIKGTLTFGAAMAGFIANSGLGLLILLRKNNIQDNALIISILLVVSIVCGLSIDFLI